MLFRTSHATIELLQSLEKHLRLVRLTHISTLWKHKFRNSYIMISAPSCKPLVIARAPKYALQLTIGFWESSKKLSVSFASLTFGFRESRCFNCTRRSSVAFAKRSSPDIHATFKFNFFSLTWTRLISYESPSQCYCFSYQRLDFFSKTLWIEWASVDHHFDSLLVQNVQAQSQTVQCCWFPTWMRSCSVFLCIFLPSWSLTHK